MRVRPLSSVTSPYSRTSKSKTMYGSMTSENGEIQVSPISILAGIGWRRERTLNNSLGELHRAMEARLAAHRDLGLLGLRVAVAGHMLWAAQLHVFSWARLVGFSEFLEGLGFPGPLLLALLAIASLVVCGIALVLGAYTRLAAAIMIVYFIVAACVDALRPYPAPYAALASLAVVLCLAFTGAGRWSLDRRLRATP